MVAPIPLIGVWHAPSRLRPAARPAAIFIQAAYGWTAVGGALLVYSAISALARGGLPAHHQLDAVRHVLAIGTVTMMIIGMAYLLTPAFALPRQKRPQSVREIRLMWSALMLATVLRFLSAWIQDPGFTGLRFWLMGSAAAFAWLAIATFARALYRGARTRPLPPPIADHREPQA